MPNTQIDSVKKDFVKYLDTLGLSPRSHKNYRSDLGYFLSWTILKIRSFGAYVESLTEVVPFLNADLGREFKNYMSENGVPVKTINRRLSTLRHLSRFLTESHVIDHDFADKIVNISSNLNKKPSTDPIFNDFRSFLQSKKVSPNTIKNYLSDVRHFLAWLESNNHQSAVSN